MEEILTIVRYQLDIPLVDQESYTQRFLTHLKYFCSRILTQEHTQSLTDPVMLEMMQSRYPKAYQVTEVIATYLQKKYHYHVAEDEKLYLTIHLARLN